MAAGFPFLRRDRCPNFQTTKYASMLINSGKSTESQRGRADEFWHQAKAELESDEPGNEPNPDNPKPMPE